MTEVGVAVELNETKENIHGYDIVLDCAATKNAVAGRIAFMQRLFGAEK